MRGRIGHFLTGVLSLITIRTIAGLVNAQTTGGGSSGGSSDLGVLCLIIQCLIPILVFLVWTMVSIWAKNDAKSRGIENPWLWWAVVFFGGVVGLIVYLLVPRVEAGKKASNPYFSYESGQPQPGRCPHCGFDAGTTIGRCPSCGCDLRG